MKSSDNKTLETVIAGQLMVNEVMVDIKLQLMGKGIPLVRKPISWIGEEPIHDESLVIGYLTNLMSIEGHAGVYAGTVTLHNVLDAICQFVLCPIYKVKKVKEGLSITDKYVGIYGFLLKTKAEYLHSRWLPFNSLEYDDAVKASANEDLYVEYPPKQNVFAGALSLRPKDTPDALNVLYSSGKESEDYQVVILVDERPLDVVREIYKNAKSILIVDKNAPCACAKTEVLSIVITTRSAKSIYRTKINHSAPQGAKYILITPPPEESDNGSELKLLAISIDELDDIDYIGYKLKGEVTKLYNIILGMQALDNNARSFK